MIKNDQKFTWGVDAVLFCGLIGAFFMDETGLPFHQWLGIAVGILSNYHLLSHWRWVKSAAGKLFEKAGRKPRLYFVVDTLMAAGLMTIVTTGVAMSTWLNLPLTNYPLWKTVHIAASIVTSLVTLLKISLHWKWIIKTAQRLRLPPIISQPRMAEARIPVGINENVGRREFLKMMGIVSAATLLASVKAFEGLEGKAADAGQNTSEIITAEAPSGSTITSVTNSEMVSQPSGAYATVVESESSLSCTSLCREGCSFPGRCHRYIDSNGNGRCDNGECA